MQNRDVLRRDTVVDATSGGGGGTNVEANPQGTPTDWLNSLKVGNLIYGVAKVAEHYTTAERIIGTWDGKPLYRRILPQISMNSGGYSYTHNIGVKYYINFGGHCTVNGTPSQNLPFPFYQNRWNGYCAIQSTDNNSIVFDATWNNNTIDCYIDYTTEADYT